MSRRLQPHLAQCALGVYQQIAKCDRDRSSRLTTVYQCERRIQEFVLWRHVASTRRQPIVKVCRLPTSGPGAALVRGSGRPIRPQAFSPQTSNEDQRSVFFILQQDLKLGPPACKISNSTWGRDPHGSPRSATECDQRQVM